MAAEITVVDDGLGELKIWSLHGIPFCGAGDGRQCLSGDRIALDEARPRAVRSPRQSRAVEGRSSIEVRGPERDAPPENHYRGPSLSWSSICADAISNLMWFVQLWSRGRAPHELP